MAVSFLGLLTIEELGARTALVTILDHSSENLQIIYFPAMLQWPNESY